MARMAVFGFWVLILLAVTAFMSSGYSDSLDMNSHKTQPGTATTTPIKELKEHSYSQGISREEIQTDDKSMEDYSQIDPSPKSTATIVSRPVEHGTPIIPRIPGPTLPYHPKKDRFDSPPSPA